jgi:hypothetical protein
MTVFANGRSILHQGDGGVQTCPIPDVCKTPSPAGPVPVPYVNVALDSDLAKGASKVKVCGKMPAIKDAELSTSSGDEAGSAGGGVVSAKTKGKLIWAACSPDVAFEGKGVIRFLEICLHNGNVVNTGGNAALGSPSVGLTYGEDAPCQVCGKREGHQLPSSSSTESKAATDHANAPKGRKPGNAKRNQGYMLGVLEATDSSGQVTTFTAASGKKVPGLSTNPSSSPDTRKHIADGKTMTTPGGRKIKIEPASSDTNDPGNCAAPKMIQAAIEAGLEPVAMTEFWVGPGNSNFSEGAHAESCNTCKRILPAMLCPEPPDPSEPDKVHVVDQALP